MIFNNMTKHSIRNIFRTITYLLIFAFGLTLIGCQTTSTMILSEPELKYGTEYEIVEVHLKNGTVLNLKDKNARFYKKYKDQENVIVYSENAYDRFSAQNINNELKILLLKDITEVIAEKSEGSAGKTILVTVGVIAGIFLIFIIVLAASFKGGKLL